MVGSKLTYNGKQVMLVANLYQKMGQKQITM